MNMQRGASEVLRVLVVEQVKPLLRRQAFLQTLRTEWDTLVRFSLSMSINIHSFSCSSCCVYTRCATDRSPWDTHTHTHTPAATACRTLTTAGSDVNEGSGSSPWWTVRWTRAARHSGSTADDRMHDGKNKANCLFVNAWMHLRRGVFKRDHQGPQGTRFRKTFNLNIRLKYILY